MMKKMSPQHHLEREVVHHDALAERHREAAHRDGIRG